MHINITATNVTIIICVLLCDNTLSNCYLIYVEIMHASRFFKFNYKHVDHKQLVDMLVNILSSVGPLALAAI